ncbi:NADH-FMN oxidoreductase RutF, flavin reductase (DIM6/NTAB) family [Candidatus Kryptonium thompsonii]|uniref:NADH-FMN oxidoreductase RutF, flavin reductase (DIM6/NTAB) family n=1 Tax=Candidatus Kryptonium thompsonii TaxID=1633631 RepID=A0A0P1P9M2_9BACT|nr:flavin reductase family protein [Candidatus Kryptonium thompsoni]CUS76329.1 NADH-FMN oxidoreductase RutF, flavin reductase (DIM6/NTAB) family [Candidatus Kryptonium thompsoni]CUS78258.1 NADH-FMN oxidoreductase RutF, flavin reductase (DIM6/NTAB) family [Candidatus Kryptonium thompsoni]CUS80458.1 NADH-FMN oxidoreductase RutF, flavin reductase (DIM6/NTAB) family [Candidatus Kryptonium thompsoni]CUS81918.1 NADH-FMN oxidoreductase RutF, flavin reductase (DIM6/NTAB) family [Candidatus Kryptonium t
MKREISLDKANRLLNIGGVVLITAKFGDRDNVTPVAWNVPVSKEPALVAVAIAPERFIYELIEKSKEFAINLPTLKILKEVYFCGKNSGRDVDKFERTKLTREKAKFISAPLIKECIANIECKVESIYPAGDHNLIIGKVLRAIVEEKLFDDHLKVNLEEAKTIHHLGGSLFTVPEKIIDVKKIA